MKTFQQFKEESTQIKKITKNPAINPETGIEKKNWAGNVETGPDIHGLKSGNKYPNNIMDLPDSNKLKKQYFNEPETKKYFKSNPKIKMQFYMEKEPRTYTCLLYTSPSPRDLSTSRMPSSA